MSRKPTIAACLTLLVTGGCWFAETGPSIAPDRPPRVGPPLEPSRGPTDAGGDPAQATRTRTRTTIPQAGELSPRPVPPHPITTRASRNGLTIAVERAVHPMPERSIDHFALTIPHGPSSSGDRHAVAALTARVIAESPRTDAGLPSLRDSIESKGGILEILTDGVATRFRVAIAGWRFEEALTDVFDAVGRAPTAPQIESVQRRFLSEVSEYLAADPVDGVLRRVASAPPSSRHPLDALQDVSRAQVVMFQRLAYKPAGSILTIATSARSEARIDEADRIATTWQPGVAGSPTPLQGLPGRDGVLWANGPEPVTLSLLWDTPPCTGADVAPLLVALECLLDTGPDSRLIRVLKRVLGTQPATVERTFENGPNRIRAISFECEDDQVGLLASVGRDLLADMTVRKPTPDEVRAAAENVRLQLLRERGNPADAVLATARSLMADPEAPASAFDEVIAALEKPEEFDLEAATASLVDTPVRVVAAGGRPPQSLLGKVTGLAEMRTADDLAIPRADVAEQKRQAEVYLERALTALGGRERLSAVQGCGGTLHVTTGRGPAAVEVVAWDVPNKRFRRIRRVLASTIDTVIVGDKAQEFFGDDAVDLPRDEAQMVVARMERHPLFLLGAYAREETDFRLISTRRLGERTYAILERDDPSRPRLRMHIDKDSGLVRVVDTLEHHTGIGTMTVTEHYRDYRNAPGGVSVRVPFHVTTVIDDGASGRIGVWLEFVPQPPPALAFERTTPSFPR